VQPFLSSCIIIKKALTSEEEKQLINHIKIDPAAFGIVFDLHYPVIFGYIFHRLVDYGLARDIASETFLKAFLNIGSFQWKGIPVLFWLYRIANNEMQQYYRRKKYKPESLNSLVEAHGWDTTDPQTTNEEKMQLEKDLQQHEDFLLIQQKIKRLPLLYQEVLALRYFEQKTIKEIAMIQDKKEGTVKSLLSRGIEKLKKIL
jgi:RNA polymerase sigma-70 factor (ECF subfamily)